jgi:hypothetical protein
MVPSSARKLTTGKKRNPEHSPVEDRTFGGVYLWGDLLSWLNVVVF